MLINAKYLCFWKNRVQVQRDLAIKKLLKIFLKNILLCLDSQNKERRRQETHFYASEVGISAVLARGKVDFGLFWPFRSPADTTRYGQYGLVQRESKPNWHESSQVSTNLRKKKKKKLKRGIDAWATASDAVSSRVGLGCGTLPAAPVLSRKASTHLKFCLSPKISIFHTFNFVGVIVFSLLFIS